MRWTRLIPKRHWTARYVVDRARLALWQRANPDAPWLPPSAVDFLDRWLRDSDRVVELGAGRSTAWLARRVAEVTSVEHDPRWLGEVRAALAGRDNVTLLETSDADPERYLAPLRARFSGRADLVLVDGRHRDAAALWALDHVAAGGLVVVDNAERYLPSPARGPEALAAGARLSGSWPRFAARIAGARTAWFDSGVTATLAVWAAD